MVPNFTPSTTHLAAPGSGNDELADAVDVSSLDDVDAARGKNAARPVAVDRHVLQRQETRNVVAAADAGVGQAAPRRVAADELRVAQVGQAGRVAEEVALLVPDEAAILDQVLLVVQHEEFGAVDAARAQADARGQADAAGHVEGHGAGVEERLAVGQARGPSRFSARKTSRRCQGVPLVRGLFGSCGPP